MDVLPDFFNTAKYATFYVVSNVDMYYTYMYLLVVHVLLTSTGCG